MNEWMRAKPFRKTLPSMTVPRHVAVPDLDTKWDPRHFLLEEPHTPAIRDFFLTLSRISLVASPQLHTLGSALTPESLSNIPPWLATVFGPWLSLQFLPWRPFATSSTSPGGGPRVRVPAGIPCFLPSHSQSHADSRPSARCPAGPAPSHMGGDDTEIQEEFSLVSRDE